MAQLISNMDDLIRILALQSSIKEYLAGAYKGMNEQLDNLETRDFPSIYTGIAKVKNLIKSMANK